jgi:hypothetical protein
MQRHLRANRASLVLLCIVLIIVTSNAHLFDGGWFRVEVSRTRETYVLPPIFYTLYIIPIKIGEIYYIIISCCLLGFSFFSSSHASQNILNLISYHSSVVNLRHQPPPTTQQCSSPFSPLSSTKQQPSFPLSSPTL